MSDTFGPVTELVTVEHPQKAMITLTGQTFEEVVILDAYEVSAIKQENSVTRPHSHICSHVWVTSLAHVSFTVRETPEVIVEKMERAINGPMITGDADGLR